MDPTRPAQRAKHRPTALLGIACVLSLIAAPYGHAHADVVVTGNVTVGVGSVSETWQGQATVGMTGAGRTVFGNLSVVTPTGQNTTCGNAICESGESISSCAVDCATIAQPAVCGDGLCSGTETGSSCASDCGSGVGSGSSAPAAGAFASGAAPAGSAVVSNIAYDTEGRVQGVTYGNGVTSSVTFDAVDRTKTLSFGALATISYDYDAVGRLATMSSSQLALTRWSYKYDELGQLVTATNSGAAAQSRTYAYDAVGRMTSSSAPGMGAYTYGDALHPHAVTAAGANTYVYDANGNMLSGAGRSYAYDSATRVSSVTSGGLSTSFEYDVFDRRVKKIAGANTTVYVSPVFQKLNNTVTKYYPAGGQVVAKSDANGVQYLHQDHQGSVRLVTDSTGAQVQSYDYGPYGEVIASAGARPEAYRYTGQEYDGETGLMNYKSRFYDAALGRFAQSDSIRPPGDGPITADPYAYVENSPVNGSDPSGHQGFGGVVLGFIAAAIAGPWYLIAYVVGYALVSSSSNPYFQTLGMVLMSIGSSGGNPGAIAVAVACSPISPLDPSVKKTIGWAYAAYSLYDALSRPPPGGSQSLRVNQETYDKFGYDTSPGPDYGAELGGARGGRPSGARLVEFPTIPSGSGLRPPPGGVLLNGVLRNSRDPSGFGSYTRGEYDVYGNSAFVEARIPTRENFALVRRIDADGTTTLTIIRHGQPRVADPPAITMEIAARVNNEMQAFRYDLVDYRGCWSAVNGSGQALANTLGFQIAGWSTRTSMLVNPSFMKWEPITPK